MDYMVQKTTRKAVAKKPSTKKTTTKTPTKKTTASKSVVKKAEVKPKIRIQRITGSQNLANKDLVVDLKSKFDESEKKRPAASQSVKTNFSVGANNGPLPKSKAFYSDEEDDDTLDLPRAANNRPKFGVPEEVDDDLEDYDGDEDEGEDDEEDGLSLGAIDDNHVNPARAAAVDYAAKAASENGKRGALLEDLYKEERKRLSKDIERGSGGLYRKLAFAFVFIVLILAVVVAYFLTVKTDIKVSLRDERASDKLVVNIVNAQDNSAVPDGSAAGLVKEINIEKSETFKTEGTEVIGEEVAGKVIVYNKYNKSQPLVATTRLLSASGKLYRLRSSINVPAGGQMEADVYADQPSKDNAVGAEKFTIPGLWEGMQDKIYAESKDGDIQYGQQTRKKITEDQIVKARETLSKELYDKVKADIDNTYSDHNHRIVKLLDNTVTSTIDSKVGEEKEQFSINMKAKVQVVAFNDAALKEMAIKKLKANLGNGRQLSGVLSDSLTYEMGNFDSTKQQAEIIMNFTGDVVLDGQAGVIDKNKLVNLNEDQLRAYLSAVPEVKDYQIEFFPSFIKKTPSLVDRINIQVNNQ